MRSGFFALYNETMEPVMYGKVHLSFLITGMVTISLLLPVFRRKEYRIRVKVISRVSMILILLEVCKQLYCTYVMNGGTYSWWIFPFQLCSVPMYLGAALPYLKQKGQETVCGFLAAYTFTGAVLALLYPEDMMKNGLILMCHSFFYHFAILFESLLVISSRMYGDKFYRIFILFLVLSGIAELINLIVPADCFYISPYYIQSQPVFDVIAEKLGIWPEIVIYLLSLSLFCFLLFRILVKYRHA